MFVQTFGPKTWTLSKAICAQRCYEVSKQFKIANKEHERFNVKIAHL